MIGFLAQNAEPAGGGLVGLLLPLALMGGLFYFLLIRPQQRRARAQRELLSALQVGDDVMTAGGIFGTIKEIDDDNDTVTVEIAPGTNVRMLRRGIAQRLVEEDEYEEPEEEADQTP
jgi:preprotein translocase subunit YajC